MKCLPIKKSSCTIFDNEKMALRAGALCPSSINMSTHICVLISADEADQAKFLIIILNIVEDDREIAYHKR